MFVLITPDENASRHRRVKLAFDLGFTGESQAGLFFARKKANFYARPIFNNLV